MARKRSHRFASVHWMSCYKWSVTSGIDRECENCTTNRRKTCEKWVKFYAFLQISEYLTAHAGLNIKCGTGLKMPVWTARQLLINANCSCSLRYNYYRNFYRELVDENKMDFFMTMAHISTLAYRERKMHLHISTRCELIRFRVRTLLAPFSSLLDYFFLRWLGVILLSCLCTWCSHPITECPSQRARKCRLIVGL